MKFSDITGHEYIKQRIKALVDNNRIPHAILLHGEPGIGKMAIARAAAQYIHCEHKTNGDSCGMCPSCIQHQTFNHPDIFFSYPIPAKGTSADYIQEWKHFLEKNDYESYEAWQKETKADNKQPQIYAVESDSIIHKLNLSSYSSKYKILIMWLPEKMSEECANKLLKIIEEPFEDTILIFVSDNPKAILPTIFSRTQRIEAKRLSTNDIALYLTNKFNIESQEALAIGAAADGSMLNALNTISLDSETKHFFEQFVSIMRLAYQRDITGLKRWSETICDYKREKEKRFLQYCARMVRENYIYNLSNPSLIYMTKEEETFSRKFSPFINERNVEDMIKEFNLAETDIQGNANSKIVLFDMALKITKIIRK